MTSLVFYIKTYGYNRAVALLNKAIQNEDNHNYKEFFILALRKLPFVYQTMKNNGYRD